jgi:hypothetical protein
MYRAGGMGGRGSIPEAVLHLSIEDLDVLVTGEWSSHYGQSDEWLK